MNTPHRKTSKPKVESSREYPQHDLHLRVRYCETDPMGFVHHSNYLTYFELGRTEMLRASGGNYRQMEADGLRVVVAKVECNYRKPASYDDELIIRTRIERVTPAKIIHRYEVLRNGELLTDARVTLAVINEQGQVQRVPEFLHQSVS